MSDMLISIVVPVYNVEKYIVECLDSILAQTMSAFELILVDDGSTDTSGKICEGYKEKDPRIKVIHKENGGLSSARNKGIDLANGEYICFVDSDDTIREDYLETLYKSISSDGSDLVICDIDTPRMSEADQKVGFSERMSSDEARKWLYDDRTREYLLMVVAWNKMYRSEIFQDIRYPVGKLHEDEFVIGPVLSKCRNISFVPEKLYYYRVNESGITSDSRKMDVRHLDGVDALSERVALAISDNDREFAESTFKNALYKCARFYKEAKEFKAPEMMKLSMAKYCEVFNSYKRLLNTQQRLKYFLFTICPRLFIIAYNP